MYYAKKLWAAGGGGGVVLNFVPFVAPESFDHPSKYAEYGCTVNLHEKLKVYKMTYPDADIAVEFTNALESVHLGPSIGTGATIEVFETTDSGVEISVLYTTGEWHTFRRGSTKRYMIRRVATSTAFTITKGSVWAYCYGLNFLDLDPNGPTYLKYIFFHENTLTELGYFSCNPIKGTLRINGGITFLTYSQFFESPDLTKVIIGNQLTTIYGAEYSGVFQKCTSLQVADLGTGVTSIGTDTFRNCTSLVSIICRSYNPPTLAANAFNGIPATTNFYVPHEMVGAYKAADGWSEFASRIYSINDL